MLVQTKRKQNAASGTRVKVAVRCRPPFQDEIDFAKGDFFSIVDTKEEDAAKSTLGRISLTMISGKQRDFYFDYVFGETTAQDQVYDRLARPVVADVLKGCNGTIFAYGQTGTGKTYTMGILEFVRNEHAGLIPRAIAQIFDYVDGNEGRIDMTISLSFLQLYRESIQDLLSQASGNNSPSEDNLLIREDPIKGFYVEGLQEFVVRSYLEAEALINLGLENRAIAPTMMNSTSSRSHTVLTINIEQRVQGDSQNYTKTLRSKLLMVDLAGSERVRRTVSKGTRLSEAKSINTSLSALGNVIAALAESNSAHIPYRDSKLTRLLQDSLGGTAATALIATIGPAAINYGETLSTLLFAQRCMAVKVTPIPHEEVDYAEMCAKLQAQINDLQGSMSEKLIEQQSQYEKTIEDLQNQLDDERAKTQQSALVSSMVIPATGMSSEVQQGLFQNELRLVLDTVERLREQDPEVTARIEHSWFMKPNDWSAMEQDYDRFPNGPLVSVLAFNYEILRSLYLQIRQVLRENQQRDDRARGEMAQLLATEATLQQERVWEKAHMAMEDPRFVEAQRQGQGKLDPIGSHLTPIQRYEALKKVDAQFRSNSLPVSKYDQLPVHLGGGGSGAGEEDDGQPPDPVLQLLQQRPTMFQYDNLDHFLESVAWLHQALTQDLVAINVLFARKDWHFKSLKEELTTQIVDRRKREEEVVNWSYILKYLLKSASKLRRELQAEKRANAHPLHPLPAGQRTPGMLPPPSSSNSSITSADSSRRDTLATPDTANFLANFLHHNPPSADSRLTMSSVSGFTAGFSPNEREREQHLGEDAYSEVSDSIATGRDRASTVSSGGNGQGNGGSVEPSPRERSKSSGSAGTVTSNAASSGRATGGGARGGGGGGSGGGGGGGSGGGVVQFETAEEQHAYDDALQRVQLRAKPNMTPATVRQPPPAAAAREGLYASDNLGSADDDDMDSDYSSLPSTSSRSYRSAASSSLPLPPPTAVSAVANTLRPATAAPTGHGGAPILQSSTVVTGKDGRPVIVTSPPNAKGHLGGQPARRQHQQQQHSSLDASTSSAASTSSSSMVDFQPIDISSRRGGGAGGGGGGGGGGSGGGPSMAGGNTDQHAVGKALAKNRAKKEMAQGPSTFAQEVAKSLGVQGQQARDAMAIIDQIASISPEQLAQLDAATRQEIQQLRQELGIDKFLRQQQQQQQQASQKTATATAATAAANSSQLDDDQWHQRASLAEQQHIERARSFSGASSMASSTATSATARSGSASRASSRGHGASSSAMGTTTVPPPSPPRDQTSQPNSRSSSRSRGLMNTTSAAGPTSFVTQAEIRPASVGRGGGTGGSRSNTPSNRSTTSTLTANSHHPMGNAAGTSISTSNGNSNNGQAYLRQHNLRNNQPAAASQPPPGALFVDLAAMATGGNNTNGNNNNHNNHNQSHNGGLRYRHAPPSTTPSTARSGVSSSSSHHHKYGGYDDYDDDGYYSGVADSSISSRNSSYFMPPPPPPPPPRPANLNPPPPTMMTGGGRGASGGYAAPPAGYASGASSQNSHSRYGHGHGRSGQQRPSTAVDDDDDDNDDEFSQLDSMG